MRRLTAIPLIVLCIVLSVLYLCKTAFVPIALAMLFALLLSGPVERLHARRMPRGVSASLILLIVLGALLGSLNLLWAPAQQWYNSAPQTLTIIKSKVKPVAVFVRHLEELRSASDPLASSDSPLSAGGFSDGPSTASQFLSATRHLMLSSIACVVITLFLLTGGPPMVARMTVALVDDLHVFHVMQIIDQIRAAVARFYLTQALLNLALGCATAALMSLFGLPSPVLWGAAAAVLTFIPYAGSALVLTMLTTVALVTFDSPARIAGVALSYMALATLVGQVFQPLLVGSAPGNQSLGGVHVAVVWRPVLGHCGRCDCDAKPAHPQSDFAKCPQRPPFASLSGFQRKERLRDSLATMARESSRENRRGRTVGQTGFELADVDESDNARRRS